MAATSIQLAPTNNSEANFRLWGKAISDQMLAGGWVKAADTGQIDWATVINPTAGGQIMGYEIWRSNDGGSGLTEFYLKIEYGAATGYLNNPAVYLTLGWATNGAGTLTGVISTRSQVSNQQTTASSASLFWSNLSTAVGRAQIVMFTGDGIHSSSSKGWVFSIERLRNAAFALTNDILILGFKPFGSTISTIISQVLTSALAYPLNTVTTGAIEYPTLQANINQANAVQGGIAGICLQFGQKGGLTAPSANVFGSTVGTLGVAQTNDIKITTYGAERNYIINGGSPHFNSAGVLLVTRFE